MPSFLSLFNTLTWTQNFQGSQLGPVCWDRDDDVMGNNVNPCSYVQMAKCVWVCRSLNEIRTDGLWEQLFNCSAQDKDLLHSPTRFTGQMERGAAVNRKTAMTVLFKLLKTVAKWRFYCWLLAVDYFHYRFHLILLPVQFCISLNLKSPSPVLGLRQCHREKWKQAGEKRILTHMHLDSGTLLPCEMHEVKRELKSCAFEYINNTQWMRESVWIYGEIICD